MKITVAVALFALTFLTRMLPSTLNFTPILAVALFAGSYYRGPSRFIVTMLGMVLADIYFGFYPGMAWNYGAIMLAVLLHPGLRPSVIKLAVSATAASIVFFVVSNFGVWMTADAYPIAMYTPDLAGLLDCYTRGLLFFKNTILSTFCYSTLFFGAHSLAALAVEKNIVNYGRQKR